MATMNTFMLLTTIYLPATIKRELLLRFHGNNEHFYIVDNYVFASNNKNGKYCHVSMKINTFILLTTIYLPATIEMERVGTIPWQQ